jgi:hypothetical protein
MPRAKTKTEAVAAPDEATIVAYKAFDENLQCRGFQYEVGKTYEHSGSVDICSRGFHACTNPLDVLSYYDLVGSRFAKVTLGGAISKHDDGDTKIAAGKITIEAELKLPDFIRAAIEGVFALCKTKKGDESIQSSSTYSSQLAASGGSSRLAASGGSSQLAASGDSSRLAASGGSSQLAASGGYSQLAASGGSSRLAASGDSSQLAASGGSSRLAASGDSSQLAASGDSSRLAASGDSSRLAASGGYSVISASAPNCVAKGVDGTWIALPEFAYKAGRNVCVGFATGCIGQDGLKADTFYKALGGKLVEA